jgi:hypothetical protein
MQVKRIQNVVVDEANDRTYVIQAPRALSDGEIYRAIRQEILRRGGRPLARGVTLTLTLNSTGAATSAVERAEPQTEPSNSAIPNLDESAGLASPAAPGLSAEPRALDEFQTLYRQPSTERQ